jgi:60 kDa SS-A/Ro ribonucleoprotein
MKTNTRTKDVVRTHEGAVAQRVSPKLELRRTLMTCLLWEDTFYESGNSIANRLAELVKEVESIDVALLAIEARSKMHLRHAPLFIARELARIKGAGPVVADLLPKIIQRADELTEFVAIYWKDKRQPLSAGVKRGLAAAFRMFNAYQLAKYNRDGKVKLRDVLMLCHPKAVDNEQARIWKKLLDKRLESPDTWEVALSAGRDKKETWERLLTEGKLGGLAVLRNLRNMKSVGVDESLIRERLSKGIERALPFRFISAAKYAPSLEDAINDAMLKAVSGYTKLLGRTLFVVDISGSMRTAISSKSESTRVEVAAALGILIREVCESATIYATAGDDGRRIHATEEVPPRRGLPLIDAITKLNKKLGGGGIYLKQCMDYIAARESIVAHEVQLSDTPFDRVIVLTDEQDCDQKCNPMTAKRLGTRNYIVNVAAYKYGLGYGGGWVHIDGWSERVLDFIQLYEQEAQLFNDELSNIP